MHREQFDPNTHHVMLVPSDLFFNCRILVVDLSDPEATRGATDKAKELFGKIDILVNNAGKSID